MSVIYCSVAGSQLNVRLHGCDPLLDLLIFLFIYVFLNDN